MLRSYLIPQMQRLASRNNGSMNESWFQQDGGKHDYAINHKQNIKLNKLNDLK